MKFDQISAQGFGFSFYTNGSDRAYYSAELTDKNLILYFTDAVVHGDDIISCLRTNGCSFNAYDGKKERVIKTHSQASFCQKIGISPYRYQYVIVYHLHEPKICLFEDEAVS